MLNSLLISLCAVPLPSEVCFTHIDVQFLEKFGVTFGMEGETVTLKCALLITPDLTRLRPRAEWYRDGKWICTEIMYMPLCNWVLIVQVWILSLKSVCRLRIHLPKRKKIDCNKVPNISPFTSCHYLRWEIFSFIVQLFWSECCPKWPCLKSKKK